VKLLFLDFDGVLHDVDAVQITYDGGGVDDHRRAPVLAPAVAGRPGGPDAGRAHRRELVVAEPLLDRGTPGTSGKRRTSRGRHDPLTDAAEIVSTANRFQECQAVAMAMGATDWLIVDDQPSACFRQCLRKPEMMARAVFCDPVIGPLTLWRLLEAHVNVRDLIKILENLDRIMTVVVDG
jgi:hypothetical protein